MRCKDICKNHAIYFENTNLNDNLNEILLLNPDCIELHIKNNTLNEINEFLDKLSNYKGIISLCGGVSDYDNILSISKNFEPYEIIIQADGKSISGFDDEIKTTTPCVECAKLYQNIPQYLFVSGGTNSKTKSELLKNNVNFKGIAFGTRARKIKSEEEARALILSVQEQN